MKGFSLVAMLEVVAGVLLANYLWDRYKRVTL